jgi:membrane protease YdiL (CAAX protease family)
LLLGWARVRSGSLWTPLLVHAALNALAYMEWVVLERVLA